MLTTTQQQVELFYATCKRRGIPVPPTCKAVLAVFSKVEGFIDAESLWFMMKNEGKMVSFASVYNGLRWLCDRGCAEQKHDANIRAKVYQLTLPA